MPEPLNAHDFNTFDKKQAELGRLLFFDPILSGNRNISCATCHNKRFGSSDGLPLGIGEGGKGLGNDRTAGTGSSRIAKRIPRNSMALWNLGAKQVQVLFFDGRVSLANTYGNQFNTPAEEWLPAGLTSLLAAQALFPLTSEFEMAGNPKENEVAGAVYSRIDKAWPILARRVSAIEQYQQLFADAFDDVHNSLDISIVHIANAIGAFLGLEGQSYDSPFDKFLNGNTAALNKQQKRGMRTFYDTGCAQCHSGKLFSDFAFHALALPQFGPGRTRQFDPYARDVGRMAESDRLIDAYRFRTPSLRNIALSAPYGHNGAYATLEEIIAHHINPLANLDNWTADKVKLPHAPWLHKTDFLALDDARERARLRSRVDIRLPQLTESELADIVAFLHSLTGTESVRTAFMPPQSVPSGLPIDK